MIRKLLEVIGKMDDKIIQLFTISNDVLSISVTDFGATMFNLLANDRDGNKADVILGYKHLESYYDNGEFIGCVVAPNANRIGKGLVRIGDNEYHLAINNGLNNLHTDFENGAAKKLMKSTIVNDGVVFSTSFVDGEHGLPGNRDFSVSFELKENELHIAYNFISDKDTIFNPTNHNYFNMAGHNGGSILDQYMMIDADYITPVDEYLIPTGLLQSVDGTPFDFRKPKKIGQQINDDDQQLKYGNGYDHNFVLNNYDGSLKEVASLYDEASGRKMTCLTTQPGIQIYTANYLNRADGKEGAQYGKNDGVCFETQFFPDAVNHDNFETTIVKANERITYKTVYRFTVE